MMVSRMHMRVDILLLPTLTLRWCAHVHAHVSLRRVPKDLMMRTLRLCVGNNVREQLTRLNLERSDMWIDRRGFPGVCLLQVHS